MEARAQHEFAATNPDELSFSKGAILKVRHRDVLGGVVCVAGKVTMGCCGNGYG